jgi:hypothetical protein
MNSSLKIEKSADEEIITLYRPDRLSGTLIALLVFGFPFIHVLRKTQSLSGVFFVMMGSPMLIYAVLVGLFIGWRWLRHDVIGVTDRAITLERRVGLASLGAPLEMDRRRLNAVEIREAELKRRGHTYRSRQLLFLEGGRELGRTLSMSTGTAERLIEVSRTWPLGLPSATEVSS